MAKRSIELVSPASVYNRVVFGLLISVVAYLWPVQTQDAANVRIIAIAVGIVMFLSGWTAVKNPMQAVRYAANPRRTVLRLIEEWKPEPARLESEYEKSLHRFLKERLPFVKVTRQYGSARVKCDLATGQDVMIELKAGLRSTQKLQRLIGQIELFTREWDKPVIVVLLGETEEDLLHDLHRSLRQYTRVDVVTKPVEARVEEEGQG
ncbi:MAG: hypothetical protein K6U09_08155 [Acidobacteriia bacterium]|jgi:hypothetical protein|nr:hypothetical protein [Terriglobia bacterium]